MSKSKLEQVLEYLVAGNEEQAKELLHKVFIEKARAIHEELISEDEELDEVTIGGDEGAELRDQVKHHDGHIEELSDEIDAEEIMGEDEDMDLTMDIDDTSDMGDDLGDSMDDAGGDTMSNIEDTMGDLETALAELKAEFEKLEAEQGGEEDEFSMDSEEDSEGDMEDSEEDSEELDEAEEEDSEEEEEELDEQFTEEDFSDLAEAIELEKVAVPHSGEVGSGKFSPKDADAKSKSPTPPSQTERFGAKPIKTGAGPHASGYAMQTPPSSEKTKILPKDNRRKTEFQDTENEQSGNYGAKEDSKSALDTTDKTFGKGNQTSPLTHAPRK